MNKRTPPFLFKKFFLWFCDTHLQEAILGDLEEQFEEDLALYGGFKARRRFRWNVLRFFRPGIIKKLTYPNSMNDLAMIKNYFKIALRSFSKHKLFTSLNVLGLSLGMSISLLAITMAVAIYQSDDFQERKGRIHQINTTFSDDTSSKTYGSTFYATADHLKENYGFVEEVVNIHSQFHPTINHHGNELDFQGYFADHSFFDVFSFDMISGDARSALEKPFSIVLTEKTAKKLFRDENPIGQNLETDMGVFQITGVMKDLKQTHFFFEMLTSYETLRELEESDLRNDWLNYRNNYAYVLLQGADKADQLKQALSETSKRSSLFHEDQTIALESVTLTDVVPRWNISNAIGIGWDQPSLIFFLSIGILILLPAVFNHTNLSIARALKRAKEIGVRKVVGAEKHQIKAQFIVETMLMAVFALGGALLFMIPIKREFLDMVYSSQVLDTDLNLSQLLVFFGFALAVGLLAGIFPAQYFARLSPIETLKGEIKAGKNNVSGFKKGLFVFQFFLSLVFIIGVGAIGKQYSYVLNTNHGFESENVLTVPFNGINKQVAINELQNHKNVTSVTASSSLPGVISPDRVDATSNDADTIRAMQVFIGDQFLEQMKIELVWGEPTDVSKSNQNEELVLVNQEFINSMKVFNTQKDTLRFSLADGTRCRVAGILKDFNFEPLSELISPLVLRSSLEESVYALVTISSPNIKRTLSELEEIWTEIDQDVGFQASFLDDEIEKAYFIMLAQIKFFSVLSVLAISISCLGLLGMVSFTTENRTKEIAVRKIMGATDRSLYYLLTKDFIKLISVSALIAVPFSYLFYDKVFLYFLLKYGTGVGMLEIVISLTFLFLVGAASIYWQTHKVTKANPATKLRYE